MGGNRFNSVLRTAGVKATAWADHWTYKEAIEFDAAN